MILAGGKGERLKPYTDQHPKPLYPVQDKPFIIYLIEQIKAFGIEEVLLLLGFMHEQIEELIGDGSAFGIRISYDVTPVEYDTGDRLCHARELLENRFLLMYCDNYCPVDFPRLTEEAFEHDSDIQLTVYANKDHYTKDNLIVNKENGRVEVYDKSRMHKGLSGVDIGYAIIKKKVIDALSFPAGNFAVAAYTKTVDKRKMFATVTEHRYYSIGGFQRMSLTEEFFRNKRVVFLDRDGTLNVRPPRACYIERPEDFVWLPGAQEAVKLLNDNGVITVLISNQPGIARGNLTVEALDQIHVKMQADLKAHGAWIDRIYYCPHNWDEGCECRKPRPGMLYQAQKDLSLDLTRCMLFGDDERDIEAADAARCPSRLITTEYSLLDAVKDYLKETEG